MKWALLALGIAIPSQTLALGMSGEQLYRTCKYALEGTEIYCRGYILGMIDGMAGGVGFSVTAAKPDARLDEANKAIERVLLRCIPEGTAPELLVKSVRLHLELNPPKPNEMALSVVFRALAKQFPCDESFTD